MDITDEFLEVDVFLAYNGFVTVLEKLAVSLMPSVKTKSEIRGPHTSFLKYCLVRRLK